MKRSGHGITGPYDMDHDPDSYGICSRCNVQDAEGYKGGEPLCYECMGRKRDAEHYVQEAGMTKAICGECPPPERRTNDDRRDKVDDMLNRFDALVHEMREEMLSALRDGNKAISE